MMSTPITFAELGVAAWFIAFPVDGDDSGHGGFRRPQRVFEKTTATFSADGIPVANAVAIGTGRESHMPPTMPVLQVLGPETALVSTDDLINCFRCCRTVGTRDRYLDCDDRVCCASCKQTVDKIAREAPS